MIQGYILTTPQGQIVDCNEALAQMFGFDSCADGLAATAPEQTEITILLESSTELETHIFLHFFCSVELLRQQ